jgi:hypothetical protein
MLFSHNLVELLIRDQYSYCKHTLVVTPLILHNNKHVIYMILLTTYSLVMQILLNQLGLGG